MRIFYPITFLSFFLLITNQLSAQTTVKQDDMTIQYFTDRVEVHFNDGMGTSGLSAFNASDNSQIHVTADAITHDFTLTNTFPAEIIKLNYTAAAANRTAYLASPSTSTGEIKVYFNHTVDTNYSQGENAVNLSNTLDDKLIDYINNCNITLDIAIYNSASPSATTGIAGAINAAYTRGVQIRVIYDGSTSSAMIPLLNPAIPRVASPTSSFYGIMHNKFVIFDQASTDANIPVVWTGSTNWTVAQIDGPDKNSAIVIQDQALAAAYKIEFDEMWGSSTGIPNALNSKFGLYKSDNTPHIFVIGGKTIESYFSPSDGANSRIINAINSASTDIEVATMVVTRSDISAALQGKYDSGMTNINMVIDSQNPSGNQFSTIQSGILPNHAVICSLSGIMHHKFMVVDNFSPASDPLVLLGSHNWSNSAENKNDENTLIIHDAGIANQYYQAFAWIYQQAGGTVTLGVNDFSAAASGVTVYPNPSNGIVYIQNTSGSLSQADLAVYDVLGHLVMHKNYNSLTEESIDLSVQSSGIYFIRLKTAEGSFHFRMIKN